MPGLLRETPTVDSANVRPLAVRVDTVPDCLSPMTPDLVQTESVDLAGDRLVMAGYYDCAAEAVRFLVEDEGRRHNDPTVIALAEHLQARSAYMEYLALLDETTDGAEDELTQFLHAEPQSSSLTDQQRHLVETAFRGCDLIIRSPDITTNSDNERREPAVHGKVHFQNNAYLDQILSWAYCEGDEQEMI